MLKFGGWHRLWAFLSVVYLLGLLCFLWGMDVGDVENFVLKVAIVWLVPVVGFYLLGWGLQWVYRGFRPKSPLAAERQ